MGVSGVFALSEEQRQRLLACRAAWEEGEDEERLERLRQREEDAETVRAFGQTLADANFAEGGSLTYAQMAHLLSLARALAPNPNLDARLLRRPGEPEAMNHDLRELLYGRGSASARLRGFLSRRHAGGQTAMQLLCADQPETWPLITQAGLRALQLSPEQQQVAARIARERYDLPFEIAGIESYSNRPVHVGVPDSDPVLRLLSEVIVYEAVSETLEASDYLAVHRLLTRGMAFKPSRHRRASAALLYPNAEGRQGDKETGRQGERGTSTMLVREPQKPDYETERINPAQNAVEMTPAPPVDVSVDISGYTQSELLATLEREIAAQGFTYPSLTVRDYYLCLQSKPFVLLSGLSGTGKTRLTSLFANALVGDPSSSTSSSSFAQYRLLPVRPDWTDSAPIVGYVNLLAPSPDGRGQFVSTPFLEFLLRAARPENAGRAFFLCLDEMNLARVEHYFAEILSAMETSGRDLLLPDGRALRLPPNLFITGTLNLDEATHSLSRKVLDRANTIAFQEVCLREEPMVVTVISETKSGQTKSEETKSGEAAPPESGDRLPPAVRQGLFLQARVKDVAEARAKLRQVSASGADFASYVVNVLADVNGILEPHGLHFAYRVRDEALRYCANSFEADGSGLLSPDAPNDRMRNLYTALDLQLLQKVLPRLTGTREQLEIPTAELLRYAEKHPLEQTARRLRRLQSRLNRDGFAGFDAA